MVPANTTAASVWMEKSTLVGVAGQTQTLRDGKNSNLCDSETQGSPHMSKVGETKESIRLINDNLKQNNRRGEVEAQCYSMVKNTT